MSAHRRHLITRKSDAAFWCGMFGWQQDVTDAKIFDSLALAYREYADICSDDSLTVEPADWYLPDSVLKPLECSP